jgi:hypothetical protein
METTTETPTNGRKARASRQAQIPGTEKGSKELRKLHEAFCLAKYEAKAAQERMAEIKPDLLDLMESEGVDALSCDVEYGDETRRAVTTLETKSKHSTKLEKKDEEE